VSERLHLFGIRHHGPGSAHTLARALEALDPAMVLIEGPPEADAVAHFAALPSMTPPLALLAHARERPGLASFYPPAEFSPEWVALRWALARDRPVRFIDLPATNQLALRAEAEAAPAQTPTTNGRDAPMQPPTPATRGDPLTDLAVLAGYGDVEAWWNALIEEGGHPQTLFAAIEAAMGAVREDADAAADPASDEAVREARREAHMRLAIREGLDDCAGEVAAVVGGLYQEF
jgi:hypothetical protein